MAWWKNLAWNSWFDSPEKINLCPIFATKLVCKNDGGKEVTKLCVGYISSLFQNERNCGCRIVQLVCVCGLLWMGDSLLMHLCGNLLEVSHSQKEGSEVWVDCSCWLTWVAA